MKRYVILYSIASAFLAICLMGCVKEMMDYEGSEGIYFAVNHGEPLRSPSSWPYQPYSPVDFSTIAEDEPTIRIRVRITGPVKDYDRHFVVELNPDSTTAVSGVHYDPLPDGLYIPANAMEALIPIRVKKTPDLQTEERTLGIRLVANEHFELAFPQWDAIPSLTGGSVVSKFDNSLHTLRLNDVMVRPEVWLGSLQSGNRESGVLGVFSRQKMELITQVTGIEYEEFGSTETMPTVRVLLIARDMAAYLIERYDAGDPVLEEDDRLMYFEGVPWTSYVGVPWAG